MKSFRKNVTKIRSENSAKIYYWIFPILLLALLIRVINLGIYPWGFHVDELDAGYIGHYILLYGKDIFGHSWPLTFDKFGDFRPAGIFYLSGLSTFIFGLNAFAVRFPSALLGALSVIPVYFLANHLTKNKYQSLAAALILGIVPWHVVLSRATSEAVIGLFFLISGLAFLFAGMVSGSRKKIYFGSVTILISYLFYHSFRLLTPVVLFPLIFYPGINRNLKKSLAGITLLFTVITIVLGLTAAGKGRLNQVIFYRNPSLSNTFTLLTNGDGPNNVMLARTFHNKVVIYAREFMTQYASYFSPDFLFIKGGLPDRYLVPDQGVFLVFLMPFLLLGLARIIRSGFNKWENIYLIFILIVAPLPAALTYEDTPNVSRAIVMILPLVLIAGVGLGLTLEWLITIKFRFRYLGVVLISLILTGETVYFLHQYIYHAPAHKSIYRDDGVAEMMDFVLSHQQKYDRVLMPVYDELPLYYLFYSKIFPVPGRSVLAHGFDIEKAGKVNFIKTFCPSTDTDPAPLDGKVLFVDRADCKGKYSPVLRSIVRKDSTGAYKITENTGPEIESKPQK